MWDVKCDLFFAQIIAPVVKSEIMAARPDDSISPQKGPGPYHEAQDDILKPEGINNGDLTEGVQKVENISRLWSDTGLAVVWTGMILVAIAVSLDGQTISAYQPYALSAFGAHSMLAAISTLQNIL